jgi:hypothetical protein
MDLDFRTWLEQQLNRSSPLGDLAQDALGKAGGWSGSCPLTLRQAMNQLNACREAHETLTKAVAQWKRYNRTKAQ